MTKSEMANGIGYIDWFIRIDSQRYTSAYGTKSTGTSAKRSQNHKRCYILRKTLTPIGAHRLFTYGMNMIFLPIHSPLASADLEVSFYATIAAFGY